MDIGTMMELLMILVYNNPRFLEYTNAIRILTKYAKLSGIYEFKIRRP